jgi:hypothetical protein
MFGAKPVLANPSNSMESYQESPSAEAPLITLTDSPDEALVSPPRFSVEALGRKVEQKTVALAANLKREIRERPLEAAGLAAAAGFVARSLPLGPIVAVSARIAAGFGPPVLLALGAVKLIEISRRTRAQIAPPARRPGLAGPVFGEASHEQHGTVSTPRILPAA